MILYSHVVEGLMASSIQAMIEGDPRDLRIFFSVRIFQSLSFCWLRGEIQSDSYYSGMTNDESSHSSTNDLTTGMPFNEYDFVVESYTMKEHVSERFVLVDSSDHEE